MFWTDTLIQRTMFDGDDYQSPTTIRQLITFASEAYPSADCNVHRQIAFLTHKATQNFLGPMLRMKFGSVDAAKVPTMEWLDSVGSFETFARSTRQNDGNGKPSKIERRKTPKWYSDYCKSDHFQEVKFRSIAYWKEYMGELTCSWNARHPFEVMHHRDYAMLGGGDEFRFLVPLCNGCHQALNARGPRVPGAIPEDVKRWL